MDSSATRKPRLFSKGYRGCDVLLVLLLIGCPTFLYTTLVHRALEPSWLEATFAMLMVLAVLGLLRVKLAFALLAAPFFGFAAYKFINGMFFSPDWSLLQNPLFVVRWAFEVVILVSIGSYFWRKFNASELSDL